MKPTQIVVLGLAVLAAGGAYYVATSMQPEPVAAGGAKTVVVEAATVDVLVAAEPVPLGQAIGERLRWQKWPKSGVVEGMVTKDGDPEAVEGHRKLIARSTFYPGEPIRAEKLVRADRGYLSAILPKGFRAVALPVNAVSAAGGFILPNDKVDVLLTITEKAEGRTAQTPSPEARIVLENVRVLAVDQIIEEAEDGSKSVLGDTVTLQVTMDQAQTLAENRALAEEARGEISLVLRSVADAAEDATPVRARKVNKTLIRGGLKQTVKVK